MEGHGGVELILARLDGLSVARPLQVKERLGRLFQQLDGLGIEKVAQGDGQAIDVDPGLDASVGVHPVDAGEEAVDLLSHGLRHSRHDLLDLVPLLVGADPPSWAGSFQLAIDGCHVVDDPYRNRASQ